MCFMEKCRDIYVVGVMLGLRVIIRGRKNRGGKMECLRRGFGVFVGILVFFFVVDNWEFL